LGGVFVSCLHIEYNFGAHSIPVQQQDAIEAEFNGLGYIFRKDGG